MTRLKNNKFFTLIIASAFLLCTTAPTSMAALSAETLRSDLRYYHKVSREKNLDTNSREYLLQRIQDKYRATGVNLAPLASERAKLRTPVTAKSPKVTAPASAGKPRLEELHLTESAEDSRIIALAPGVRKSNYFLLKDPDPGEPLKLVLDLYGAVDALPPADRNLASDTSAFINIRTGQFKGQPDPIVRIVAELREIRPYRVMKDGDRWVLIVDKVQQVTGSSAPAPVPAPQGAPLSGTEQAGSLAPASLQQSDPVPAPAADAPAATNTDTGAGYLLDTGDVLGIMVFPADELSREAIVQTDGTIPFPLIGKTLARGRTTRQLEDELSRNLGKYIAKPQVTVTVKQFSKRQLFITGEVRSVGTFAFKNNYRLLEFISSLGGFTDNANRREIKVYRGAGAKRQAYTVDLEDVIRSGNFAKDFALQPGDIIEVPQGRSRVAVLGDVRNPGYYDYRDNLRLMELISLAGGFTDTADLTKVRILKPDGSNGHVAQQANLKNILSGKEKDVPIQNGDTVYVPKGGMANANWFVANILPWLSLISLVLVIRGAA